LLQLYISSPLSSINELYLVRQPPLLDNVGDKRTGWPLEQCQQPALHPELNVSLLVQPLDLPFKSF